MNIMLAWLLKRPWLLVSVALALGLGAALAQGHIVTGQRDMARAEAETYKGDIKRQNAAIAAWHEAAEAQSRNAVAAQEAAVKVRVVTQTRVQRILTASVPGDCNEAVRWGAEQAIQLADGWNK